LSSWEENEFKKFEEFRESQEFKNIGLSVDRIGSPT
jgi:hypothetical protein